MKLTLGSLLGAAFCLSFLFAPSAGAADKIGSTPEGAAALVNDEFRRERADFIKELSSVRRRLSELTAHRTSVLNQSAKQAETETSWIENLKRYQTLLTSRYLDEKGEYQPSKEINNRDLENINRLMASYLYSTPLQGRVSAGQAFKTLETGIEQIGDRIKVHRSPSSSNNSEIQILQAQIEEMENNLKKLIDRGKKLGFDSSEDSAQSASPSTSQ